jgi:DNA-binding response OmpR family regulator
MHVLVGASPQHFAAGIARSLRRRHVVVDVASTETMLMALSRTNAYDVIVLDRDLLHTRVSSARRELHTECPDAIIVMLGTMEDQLESEPFVAKPVDPDELARRVHALKQS